MNITVEQQIMKLFGATIRTFDENRNLLCKAQSKAFKLKEQITFYADEEQTKPLFFVQARSVFDVSTTYDFTDAATGQRIGSLRRGGLMSVFARDTWTILDANEQELGMMVEDSLAFGLLRRFIDFTVFIIPQHFHIILTGQPEDRPSAKLRMTRLFGFKLIGEIQPELEDKLGKTLALAIPSVVLLIEN